VIAVALGQGGVEQDGDFAVGDQRFGFGVRRLDGVEIALFVDPGCELAVRGPADALGRVAGEAAGVTVDFLDGPGMIGLGEERRREQSGGGQDDGQSRRTGSERGNQAAKSLTGQTKLQKEPVCGVWVRRRTGLHWVKREF
jgi:hypothetical protein